MIHLMLTKNDIIFDGDDSVARMSDLKKGATAANTAVYKPGGVDEGNVYSTWDAALEALEPVAGPKTVFVDDSIQSPAPVPSGSYDLTNTKLEGNSAAVAFTSILQFEDGAVVHQLDGILDLVVYTDSASPVLTFSGTNVAFQIITSTVQPLDGGAPFFQALPYSSVFTILTKNSEFISGPNDESVFQNLNPVPGTKIALTQFAHLNENSLEDVAGAAPLFIFEDASGVISDTQVNLNSDPIIVHVDHASGVSYSGTLAVDTVHDAIDYLTVTGTDNQCLTTVSGYLQSEVDAIDSSVTLQDAYDSGDGSILTDTSPVDIQGSEGLTVSGNVGIGTASPEALLDVASPSDGTAIMVGRKTGSPSIAARSDASGQWLIADGNVTTSGQAAINYYSEGNVILAYGAGAGGNVGIRKVNPTVALDVAGSGIFSEDLFVDGKVGIGTGSPNHTLDVDGNVGVSGTVYTPEIGNPEGLFKIQPDVAGDVELFGDTQVGNGENSKIFKIWRKASEGNDYIRFYIAANQKAFIHASAELSLQAQQPFTIYSVTDSIYFKLGDTAGAEKVYFRNKDGDNLAVMDSLGKFGIGTTAPDERLEVVGSGIFTGDLFVDGNVGIGTNDPTYQLSIASTGPALQLESTRTIMGTGYEIGGIRFSGGELISEDVGTIKVNATEDWTDTSSPTRMSFMTTPVGAIHAAYSMTLDENGHLGIGTTGPSESLEVVGSGIFSGGLTINGTTINLPNLPTTSGALLSGDLWVDVADNYALRITP